MCAGLGCPSVGPTRLCVDGFKCTTEVLSGTVKCSGDGSCVSSSITGDAVCSGYQSCMEASIIPRGDSTFCAGLQSCQYATIRGDTSCQGRSSCIQTSIRGNAVCQGVSSCMQAKISGDVECKAKFSCMEAQVSGDLITCEVAQACDGVTFSSAVTRCTGSSCPLDSPERFCSLQNPCEGALMSKRLICDDFEGCKAISELRGDVICVKEMSCSGATWADGSTCQGLRNVFCATI
jgi:hypothetical protein